MRLWVSAVVPALLITGCGALTTLQALFTPAYLGAEIDDAETHATGVVLTSVGDAAQKAGLQVDDVIVGYGETPITSSESLKTAISGHPGPVELMVYRPAIGQPTGNPGTWHRFNLDTSQAADGAKDDDAAATSSPAIDLPSIGTVQTLHPELAGSFGFGNWKGARIVKVYRGSAAQRAGLIAGDILIGLQGPDASLPEEIINGTTTCRGVISSHGNQDVRIRFVRGDAVKMVDVQLQAVNLAPGLALPLGLTLADENGVRVESVDADSLAAQAGILKDDMIRSVNHTRVGTIEEFWKTLNKGGDSGLLGIERGSMSFYVRLALTEPAPDPAPEAPPPGGQQVK